MRVEKSTSLVIQSDGFSIEGPARARSYLEAMQRGTAESFMARLFTRAVGPGMTVVDVGAFLGQYSLLAARAVGATGRVYAFEPDPRNYPFLVTNIERNGFRGRVVPLPYAVGEATGPRDLYLDPDVGSGSSLRHRRRRRAVRAPVSCVALDEFLDKAITVNVVKLDIEGGELSALAGMTRVLRRADAQFAMFVECFPKALRASGAGARALLARLERLGFTVMGIDERDRRLFPVRSDVRSYAGFLLFLGYRSLLVANLLCVRGADHPILHTDLSA